MTPILLCIYVFWNAVHVLSWCPILACHKMHLNYQHLSWLNWHFPSHSQYFLSFSSISIQVLVYNLWCRDEFYLHHLCLADLTYSIWEVAHQKLFRNRGRRKLTNGLFFSDAIALQRSKINFKSVCNWLLKFKTVYYLNL